MMYKRILLVIVSSLIIIGIRSQPPPGDYLEVMENLQLNDDDNNNDDTDDDNDDDIDDDNVDDDILTFADRLLLRQYLDTVVKLFDNVVSYFSKKSNKESSSSSRKNSNKPDDIEVFALTLATYFTFGITVTSRIYSMYNLCIFGNEPENKFDFYFDEMMFVFNKFKNEIKKYVKDRRKKKDSHSSINAVIDSQSSRDDITVEEVARLILDLSLDFVSSNNSLIKKTPDRYMKGIIDWKSISNIKIGETVYKTLFSSCYFMRMSIHNEFTEKVDIMNKRSNNNDLQNSQTILKQLKIRFNWKLPNELYSNEDKWKNIIDDMKSVFANELHVEILKFLIWRVRLVIDIDKLHRIQDFFLKQTIGNDWNILSSILKSTNQCVPYFKESWHLWSKLNNKNVIEENTEISTIKRIQNVAALVRIIREAN